MEIAKIAAIGSEVVLPVWGIIVDADIALSGGKPFKQLYVFWLVNFVINSIVDIFHLNALSVMAVVVFALFFQH